MTGSLVSGEKGGPIPGSTFLDEQLAQVIRQAETATLVRSRCHQPRKSDAAFNILEQGFSDLGMRERPDSASSKKTTAT